MTMQRHAGAATYMSTASQEALRNDEEESKKENNQTRQLLGSPAHGSAPRHGLPDDEMESSAAVSTRGSTSHALASAAAPTEASNKRRSLVALLGKPSEPLSSSSIPPPHRGQPYKSAGASERVQPIAAPPRPAATRSDSGSMASSGALSEGSDGANLGDMRGEMGAASSHQAAMRAYTESEPRSSSPSRRTVSLSQGVKSLQERYASSREASDTYRTMRMRGASGGDHQGESGTTTGLGLVDHPKGPFADSVDLQTKETSNMSLQEDFEGKPVPEQLVRGDLVLKVTTRKVMQRVLRIDPDVGQIFWQSKKNSSIPLDTICEVLTGSQARSYRTSLSIAPAHEDRWISIVYQAASTYKTLHFIALTDASFILWRDALTAIRKEHDAMLQAGAGKGNHRQNFWFRHHWNKTTGSRRSRLDFEQVSELCRRLGITTSRADLFWRFQEADRAKSGSLDFEGFQNFVAILKSRSEVEPIFSAWADTTTPSNADNSKPCQCLAMSIDRFREFLSVEQGRSDASHDLASFLCQRYSGTQNGHTLDYQGFLAFLTSADNSIVLDRAHASEASRTSPVQLREKATTAEDLVAVTMEAQVVQDMTRPIAEYFISSSHNTYLIGAQLLGDSNVQGYVRALLQGARSVELDCWDGPNGEPQVTHGRTLTTKVPFREVIEAIARYAFTSSPYPLILSLEIHTDIPQQNAIASILRSVLGDKLLAEPLPNHPSPTVALPSPQDLSGKILVKAKNLLLAKVPVTKGDSNTRTDVARFDVTAERSNTSTTDTTESESDSLLSNARDLVRSVAKRGKLRKRTEREEDKREKITMSPALSSLLIYTVGVKHRGLSKNESYDLEHMFSLSERSALKYARNPASGPSRDDLIKHNRTHLTRVYPSMNSFARLSYSANYVPSIFWSVGCQLVSLNWQTPDLGFEMNQAMFARNRRSGYVLKPESLRQKDLSKAVSTPTSVRVQVTIVSGQQLPHIREGSRARDGRFNEDLPVIDPFVSVALLTPEGSQAFVQAAQRDSRSSHNGRDEDTQPDRRAHDGRTHPGNHSRTYLVRKKTSTVPRNSFDPRWNELLSFHIETPCYAGTKAADGPRSSGSPDAIRARTGGMLDLCFLRFEVRNGNLSGQEHKATRPETRTEQMVGSQSSHEVIGDASCPKSDHDSTSQVALDDDNVQKLRHKPVEQAEDHLHSPLASRPDPSSSSSGMPALDIAASSVPHGTSSRDLPLSTACTSVAGHVWDAKDAPPPLGTYMVSLGAMQQGYHHVPLLDAQLNPHVFSTLFVHTRVTIEACGSNDAYHTR